MARGKTGGGLRGRLPLPPSPSAFLGSASPGVVSVNSGWSGWRQASWARRRAGDAGSGVTGCPRSSSPQRPQQKQRRRRRRQAEDQAEVRGSLGGARLRLPLLSPGSSGPLPRAAPDGSGRMWLFAVATTFWGWWLAPGKRGSRPVGGGGAGAPAGGGSPATSLQPAARQLLPVQGGGGGGGRRADALAPLAHAAASARQAGRGKRAASSCLSSARKVFRGLC